MHATRINVRLTGALAEFFDSMAGESGPYETASEYIRDLIRKDMERQKDMKIFAKKEKSGRKKSGR